MSPRGRALVAWAWLAIGLLELLKHRPTDAVVAFGVAAIIGAVGGRP